MEENNIENIDNKYPDGIELRDTTPMEYKPRLGNLMVKCGCGSVYKLSDEPVQDGLNWNMIIGNDHYIKLHCEECGADLTMYIQEIFDEDELPKESNKE